MRTTGRKRWERERQSKGGRKKRHSEGESESPMARPGSPTTHYETDPLKGDKRAHLVAKKLKQNWKPRKIAKFMGIPLAEVEAVIKKKGL